MEFSNQICGWYLQGEDDKVIEYVWASVRHKLSVSPYPLMIINPSVRLVFFFMAGYPVCIFILLVRTNAALSAHILLYCVTHL